MANRRAHIPDVVAGAPPWARRGNLTFGLEGQRSLCERVSPVDERKPLRDQLGDGGNPSTPFVAPAWHRH